MANPLEFGTAICLPAALRCSSPSAAPVRRARTSRRRRGGAPVPMEPGGAVDAPARLPLG